MFGPLKLRPVFKDYLWGGRNLERLGKNLPEGIVAESWEVSCHEAGPSVVSEGPLAGVTLQDLVARHPVEMLGTSLAPRFGKIFPLLVKLIDANDRLSVQVHPDDRYAALREGGQLGKNEMWYILQAKPGARLVCDVKPGLDREGFRRALEEGRIEDCLGSLDVVAGDFVNIPAGMLHAIGSGILLLEVQQSSNLTYRVYDYDRLDPHGQRRELHTQKALEVIDFSSSLRSGKRPGLTLPLAHGGSRRILVINPYFQVEEWTTPGSLPQDTLAERFVLYTVIEGRGQLEHQGQALPLSPGQTVFVPAQAGEHVLAGRLKLVRATIPDSVPAALAELSSAGLSPAELAQLIAGLDQR